MLVTPAVFSATSRVGVALEKSGGLLVLPVPVSDHGPGPSSLIALDLDVIRRCRRPVC